MVIDVFHLPEQRARELRPVLEHCFAGALKNRQLRGVGTLVGEEQAQVGKDPVLTDEAQGTFLLLSQRYVFLREEALRILKGQFLIQGTGRLIVIAVRLLDHF